MAKTVKNKELLVAEERLIELVDELFAQQLGRCALTNLSLQLDGDCSDPALLCSLDRIDSGGHYAQGNLQLVCRFVNKWKGSQPDAEFRRLLALLSPMLATGAQT